MRVALLGGIYNNYIGLEAACNDAESRGCDKVYCLGDLGAFGPYPDRVFPLLKRFDVSVVQGNYDDSLARSLDDCQCGYTDPRDNHFAHLSYQYTFMNTSREHREYLGSLPKQLRLVAGERRLLMCHGSPRRVNEFLWESTTPTHLCEKFCRDFGADIIAVTHTGIHWKRALSDGKWFVNVGAIGRPANDGRTEVWYAILDTDWEDPVEFISLPYDFRRLAREMSDEGLPEEFIETVLTGYWTTCLEILPARERKRGIH